MSATNIGLCPTSKTVGFSIVPNSYPAGIAARIPIISFSRLSNEPALLLDATMTLMTKLIRTFVVAPLIKTTSIYGEPGKIQIAGGIGDSGTDWYTLASRAENVFARAARVPAMLDAGIIERPFQRPGMALIMWTPCWSNFFPFYKAC